MAVARDERHRFGQHYTPLEVASLLAAFAVRSPHDLIFDPSCGDGRLLAQALTLKRELGSRPSASRELYGIDRERRAIELATQSRAQVACADFFNVAPAAALNQSLTLPSAFDAIVGNPPYIRQELMGRRDKQRIERRLNLDREASCDIDWPRWSGRSDIYVYFFAHATAFLKSGGRLVFITASSWLDAGYGAALREFLLENFRVIAVIESNCESFFQDASINTAITVLEREPDPRARSRSLMRFVRLTAPLSKVIASNYLRSTTNQANAARLFAKQIERACDPVTRDNYGIRVVEQSQLMPAPTSAVCKGGPPWPPLVADRSKNLKRGGHGGPPLQGWGKFLRADDIFFRILERGAAQLQPLSNFARVRFGVKTGANEFFYLSDEQRAKQEKEGAKNNGRNSLRALREFASIRRGLTTGANEFFYLPQNGNGISSNTNPQHLAPIIEPEYLSPVVFSLKELPGIVLEHHHARKFLFNCGVSREELAGTHALEYIESGERAGYDQRPTCASRDPWYAVAREMKPAPLIFPSKVGERWLVALNRANVFEDKKLYGIFPRRGVSILVLAALLNSTWARYYAEVTCRQMTGAQAIADIDVAVAEQTMIPDPRELSSTLKKKLEAALVQLSRRPVYSVFEEIKCADRRELDALTLEAIGFSGRSEREAVLNELYAAVTELVRARLSKARI
jgi:methylase of polypeptide subunit release factors